MKKSMPSSDVAAPENMTKICGENWFRMLDSAKGQKPTVSQTETQGYHM